MAKWIHPNGDTIETNGTVYTVTQNGNTRSANVSKWHDSAERWIENDIRDGYYQGFTRVKDGANV
jgi:hypothetical protein